MDFNFKQALLIAVIVVIGAFIISTFLAGDNTFGPVNVNPEIVVIPQEYEVTNVYRVYNGKELHYCVDYIDNGTILTIVLPTYRNELVVIPNPVNNTYLVYKERWILYDNGNIQPGDDRGEYELHLSNNAPIYGAPTSYSRSKMSDVDTTVIII